jgi:hypothetical protein
MRCAGFVADENVQSAIMLISTENEETPTGQWVKGILNSDFGRRNRGTMSPFPTAAESIGRWSRR